MKNPAITDFYTGSFITIFLKCQIKIIYRLEAAKKKQKNENK